MADATELHSWIRGTRLELGLSLSECATACSISKSFLVDIEQQRRPCSFPLFVRLCRAFNYEVWSAIEWFDDVLPRDVIDYLLVCAKRRLMEGADDGDDGRDGTEDPAPATVDDE